MSGTQGDTGASGGWPGLPGPHTPACQALAMRPSRHDLKGPDRTSAARVTNQSTLRPRPSLLIRRVLA